MKFNENKCNKDEFSLDSEIIRRNIFLSSRKDDALLKVGRYLLEKYGYAPIHLCPEDLIDDHIGNSIGYGVDDILITDDIQEYDFLDFKQVKPANKDYFTIDYRSNNFRSYNKENDDYVFVKLMEFLPRKHYNRDFLLEQRGKGIEVKIKGILSDKNPDYLFTIRNTNGNPRGSIPDNSLINAYLLPVEPLKSQVIHYLNIFRRSKDKDPLTVNKDIIDLILETYHTWQLYREDRNYPEFELIRAKDSHNDDLFMKLSKHKLLNYIKFNSNGSINESIS